MPVLKRVEDVLADHAKACEAYRTATERDDALQHAANMAEPDVTPRPIAVHRPHPLPVIK